MIKIKKGETRVVFILFNYLVIKCAYPFGTSASIYLSMIKSEYKRKRVVSIWKNGLICKLIEAMYCEFCIGISANVCEGWFWSSSKFPLFQPTLCLVVCNIQHYAGENLPDEEYIDNLLNSLPADSKTYLSLINPHEFETKNWRVVNERLRLIDYGSKIYARASLPAFILKFREEILQKISQPTK